MANDYPLFCYSGLSSDDFAGWFSAMSSSTECKDFCFWRQPPEYYDGNTSYTTADPHQLTQSKNGATWGCLVDATDEEITWNNAFDIYEDFSLSNTTFPFLRCSRGPEQQLKSTLQNLSRSKGFWFTVLFLSLAIHMTQVIIYVLRKRRAAADDEINPYLEPQRDVIITTSENGTDALEEVDDTNAATLNELVTSSEPQKCAEGIQTVSKDDRDIKVDVDENPTEHDVSSKTKKFIKKGLIVAANLITLFIIFVSTLSLLELQSGVDLPFVLKVMTPACADTESLCPEGHAAIDRESMEPKEESFSYIIGSDPQIDWYDGEAATIGRTPFPPPCLSADSCESCTKKVGTYTNEQMKKSFEKLLEGSVENGIDQPIPKTLVMNGDLTQYFHRFENEKYASIYHSIKGLQEYFPSLGNHDYDQGSATYGGDEWIGPKYCNGRHATAYFRSSFCGRIPKFDAKQRLTRYDPGSMAYSWEQGSFHFVNVHYYPTYENAALGISSSLKWVERDLMLANAKNLTTVFFVHAVHGIPQVMEQILLDNNVAVIFAGHLHRCFGPYCDTPRALNTQEAADYLNNTELNRVDKAEKCFPASAGLCGTNANGNGLFYLSDMSDDMTLPSRKLFSRVPDQTGPCPSRKFSTYINTTDNTALCTGRPMNGKFPFDTRTNKTTIPVFWSGSASYETFLLASFHKDRIVVNMMTATEGNEGRRYIDSQPVPNAVYPSHNVSSLEEFVITVKSS